MRLDLKIFKYVNTYVESGCSYWSKMLKKLQFSRASIQDRERKWEMQLNSIQIIKNFFLAIG